jgi:hypothetical protein
VPSFPLHSILCPPYIMKHHKSAQCPHDFRETGRYLHVQQTSSAQLVCHHSSVHPSRQHQRPGQGTSTGCLQSITVVQGRARNCIHHYACPQPRLVLAVQFMPSIELRLRQERVVNSDDPQCGATSTGLQLSRRTRGRYTMICVYIQK